MPVPITAVRSRMGVLGGGGAAAPSSLLTGLKFWWPGESVNLSVGGGPMTNTNTVTFGADYAQFVAASSKKLVLATNPAVEFTQADFALSFWFYFDTLIDYSMIVTKIGATTNQEIAVFPAPLGGVKAVGVTMYEVGAASQVLRMENSAYLVAGKWYHCVVNYVAATKVLTATMNAVATDTMTLSANLRGASNANFLFGGRGDEDANYLNGKMKQVGKWDRILTATEITNLYANGAGATHPTFATYVNPKTTHITTEGDSITEGNNLPSLWTYPRQLIGLLGLPEQNLSQKGVGGSYWATVISRAAACDATISSAYSRNILVVYCGVNDLRTDQRTVNQVETDIAAYCTARRAAGWTGVNKLIIGTLTPASMTGTSVNYETNRQDVNTWIRANYATWADGVADFGANSFIGDSGDETDLTYYLSDKVHPGVVGSGVMASVAAATINAL